MSDLMRDHRQENGRYGPLKERCQAPSCSQTARTAGYCPRHYQQLRRHGRLTPESEYETSRSDASCACRANGCKATPVAKGYCPRHYQQLRRHGRLTPERERVYGRTSCTVDECQCRHFARGYCKKHYDLN